MTNITRTQINILKHKVPHIQKLMKISNSTAIQHQNRPILVFFEIQRVYYFIEIYIENQSTVKGVSSEIVQSVGIDSESLIGDQRENFVVQIIASIFNDFFDFSDLELRVFQIIVNLLNQSNGHILVLEIKNSKSW